MVFYFFLPVLKALENKKLCKFAILTIPTRDHFSPDQIPPAHNSHSENFSLFFIYSFIFDVIYLFFTNTVTPNPYP